MEKEWNLSNIPPEDSKAEVGEFSQELFEMAYNEKVRLGLPNKWTYSYEMYRGDHWQRSRFAKKNKSKVTVNLFFSNINRTVSNITARRPVAEVVDLEAGTEREGEDDLIPADSILTAKVRKWWKESHQQLKLKETSLKNEKYGITIEHPVWDKRRNQPDIIVMDPFTAFPAPGNWKNFDSEAPYFCKAFADTVDNIEKAYNLDKGTVETDDVYSTMGEYREETRPVPAENFPGATRASGNYADPQMRKVHEDGIGNYLVRRALVIELWIRDAHAKIGDEDSAIMHADGETKLHVRPSGTMKYPDGVRRITFTNKGRLVLDDTVNPNINWGLPIDGVKGTHAWGRLPFYKTNSYMDTTSPWGFSAIDQVGDLNKKVDEIMSRLLGWIMRVMYPPLIVPKETGITRAMITNRPNLVLMPERIAHSSGIRFEPVPNLPSNFIEILNIVLSFFDRVYQIEDADRGVGPKGVTAASAIVALQERNAVLIAEKISAIDYMVENRGRWFISMNQNQGYIKEPIEVEGKSVMFRGDSTIGRRFNFVVESGSTMPRTSLQLEEQAKELYKAGAIDREALLESLNFPNWKKIIERAGEGQIDQALQILIDAGLEEQAAADLKQVLMQPQEGAGGTGKASIPSPAGRTVEAGAPRSTQGAQPPAGVKQNARVGIAA